MKLYEFEGQAIIKKVGIEVPFFVVISSLEEVKQARKRLKFPIVAKVQVLTGGRGKGGGIKIVRNQKQLLSFVRQHIGRKFGGEEVRFITDRQKTATFKSQMNVERLHTSPALGGQDVGFLSFELVKFIVLAQAIDIKREYYISITYDTTTKAPFILFSPKGGIDVEQLIADFPDLVRRVEIDPSGRMAKKDIERMLRFENTIPEPFLEKKTKWVNAGWRLRTGEKEAICDFALRLWDAFGRYDCRLVEVNPLAQTASGELVAVDAKVILDDAGLARHRDLDVLPKGAVGAVPSEREILAKQIDETDYRGTAGSTFIEFAGDIAILASGGGASLLVMDALAAAGGKPANYTEYSGNPPAEKVEKLTKITLSREGLSGCLVAGAVANFTDIYETLSGFIKGLGQVKPKPDYPIVIRRGGPRQNEAYEMLAKFAKKEGYDIHLFGPETPISVACWEMVELAYQYKRLKIKDKK